MREIKFRAWHKSQGYSAPFDIGQYPDFSGYTVPYWFYCCPIEQFTGLLDANGVEIYEGDVCRHESLPGAKDGLLVVFENMGYKLKGKMSSDDIILCDNSNRFIEVIGNIHEGIK